MSEVESVGPGAVGVLSLGPDGSVIIEAVGHAGGRGKKPYAKLIEMAMIEATVKAHAEGITDPDQIRALKLAAREKVKADIAAADAPKADSQPSA